MKRVFAAAVVIMLAGQALAVPRARSAEECNVLADLALNAAAHAKHRIARETFDAIVPDIYDLGSEEARELARRVIDAAWRAANSGTEPGVFATQLNLMCQTRRGNLDAILGTSL